MKITKKLDHKYDIDKMSTFELSRWISLMEGVNLVVDKAEDRGIPLKKVNFKQPAMSKYIESTCDIIAKNIEREENHG